MSQDSYVPPQYSKFSLSDMTAALFRIFSSFDALRSGRNLLVKTDASGAIGTVTTVSTVTNLSQLGGVSANEALIRGLRNISFANNVTRWIS